MAKYLGGVSDWLAAVQDETLAWLRINRSTARQAG